MKVWELNYFEKEKILLTVKKLELILIEISLALAIFYDKLYLALCWEIWLAQTHIKD